VTSPDAMSSMLSRPFASAISRSHYAPISYCRALHASRTTADASTPFDNILAGSDAPPVEVKTVTNEGIQLADGLVIPGPCIFLEDKVFLWKVPEKLWEGWNKEHFEVFEMVVPKPEILLLGTGKRVAMLPPALRQHLNRTGIQVDVMDTRNACSTYNLLLEEGRKVAAALLPLSPHKWHSAV